MTKQRREEGPLGINSTWTATTITIAAAAAAAMLRGSMMIT